MLATSSFLYYVRDNIDFCFGSTHIEARRGYYILVLWGLSGSTKQVLVDLQYPEIFQRRILPFSHRLTILEHIIMLLNCRTALHQKRLSYIKEELTIKIHGFENDANL